MTDYQTLNFYQSNILVNVSNVNSGLINVNEAYSSPIKLLTKNWSHPSLIKKIEIVKMLNSEL